ncbi:methyltransferase domain-containing protein [Acinetobacter junii]|uniref:methyltransferase domain-containing protein n=1 Tax=Acinetobacter junii TaxID=40215 RepID=UPI00384E24FC
MTYTKICEGVYQVDEKGARHVELDNKQHSRFMDYFYIELPSDELSEEQVFKLCQARVNERRCFDENSANAKVKGLFNEFLKGHSQKSVLEVGAGTNPILTVAEAIQHSMMYKTSDADDNYQGLSYHFNANTDLPNETFDIVIALFVLHFKFYEHQISQIFKHIKDDGIFLANVYNRTDNAREVLVTDFKEAGFHVELFRDPNNICRDHYYLFASKSKQIISSKQQMLIDLIQNSA